MKSYYIKTLVGHVGHSALYVVDPPYEGHDYIVVEAYSDPMSPCTWINAANEAGEITRKKPLLKMPHINDHGLVLETIQRPLVYRRVVASIISISNGSRESITHAGI